MRTNDKTKALEVIGITAVQKSAMLTFIKGAINTHCGTRPDEWFCAWDFLSGVNKNWNGTPLQGLYRKWIIRGKQNKDAIKLAGIDAGKLLKKAIAEDSKNFESPKSRES